jgi:hypothetical protein
MVKQLLDTTLNTKSEETALLLALDSTIEPGFWYCKSKWCFWRRLIEFSIIHEFLLPLVLPVIFTDAPFGIYCYRRCNGNKRYKHREPSR